MKSFFAFIFFAIFLGTGNLPNSETRYIQTLSKDWKFINQEVADAQLPQTNATNWETVEVPHDWAIKGPFDKEIDAQKVSGYTGYGERGSPSYRTNRRTATHWNWLVPQNIRIARFWTRVNKRCLFSTVP